MSESLRTARGTRYGALVREAWALVAEPMREEAERVVAASDGRLSYIGAAQIAQRFGLSYKLTLIFLGELGYGSGEVAYERFVASGHRVQDVMQLVTDR